MQDSFYRIICQVGIFMICAQTIIHFKPKETYGKYLKMLLSVMILAQLFQPVARLFLGSSEKVFWEKVERFQMDMEQSMEQVARQAVQSEQLLNEMSLMELEERATQSMQSNTINIEGSVISIEKIEISDTVAK